MDETEKPVLILAHNVHEYVCKLLTVYLYIILN